MRKSNFLTVILTALFLMGLTVQVDAQSSCTPTNHKPTSGVDYTYQVAIAGQTGATNPIYTWYITKSTNLLDNGSVIDGVTNNFFEVTSVLTSNESKYNSTTSAETKDKIKLKWKNDAIADQEPFYLVVKYSETANGCTTNNLKAMEIMPLNQFKLAIAPAYDAAGAAFPATSNGANVCAADVTGATVTPGNSNQGTATSNTTVKYTYGENTLYYKVTASGFVGDWTPAIQLPALQTGQTYVSAHWSDDNGSTWKDFGAATTAKTQDLTSTANASITDVAGSSIVYRVVINNNTYETLTDQAVAVATDGKGVVTGSGIMNDQKDDCSADETAFADKETVTIKKRPTVTATSGGFLITVQ